MVRAIEDVNSDMKYNHLPYWRRFAMFLGRYKWKLFFFGLFASAFNYWGNGLGFITARMERSYRKYKKRWIIRYNPQCITYTTALDTMWEPKKLSRTTTEKLSELFVQIDKEMEYGFSRQLVVDVLKKVSFD